MAKNDISNSENILVKVDQNNLVFIDPNSVVEDGIVQPRGTNQENLVFYVNLEADLVPRTILNTSTSGVNSLTPIAKGTLNLLQNKNGSDYLDTTWTDTYTNQPSGKKDKNGNTIKEPDTSGQSFGIANVDVVVKGANFIPYVNITFIDVRGKTLFDNPENSPYAAFFHLPWPIFYLTIKGYYGKAIRYRLHLVSFNTSYNNSNGNFESVAKFAGSTYAYLNDISLTSILNSPYMYGIEIPTQEKINEKDGQKQIKLSKSSRGYQTLVSVYDEYRRKGLVTIPEDQNPTLREVITKAKKLDQILERKIFGEEGVVDMKLFGLVKEFDEQLIRFVNEVTSWQNVKTTNEPISIENVVYRFLTKTENNNTSSILGDKGGTLETIIKNNKAAIQKNQTAIRELLNQKSNKNKFRNFNVNIKNPIKDVSSYITKAGDKWAVATPLLISDINDIIKTFNEEKTKLQDYVEEIMNDIIKSKGDHGLGFEPTIRNIFGVILAGADTYVKLMNNVHIRAYNAREDRSPILRGYSDETTKEGPIYPWPEVKKDSIGDEKVLAYPGDPDLVRILNSDDASLWPEVEFVEEHMAVSQQITDNLAEKERTFDNTTYVFENSDVNPNEIKETSMINTLVSTTPYSDKTLSSVIYEIYERIRFTTLTESFDTQTTLNELAKKEFQTLKELVKEDYFLVDILREIKSVGKLKEYLQSFSPFERYPYFEDGIPTTPYIKDVLDEPFKLTSSSESKKDYSQEYDNLSGELLNYEVENYRLKIYPFNSPTYLGYQYKSGVTKNDMSVRGIYKVDTSNGFIKTHRDGNAWVKSNSKENLFNTNISIGTNSTTILNTPYFHKKLYEDFRRTNSNGKYKSSAYLLLNSLPFLDLDQNIQLDGYTSKMSNIFKEVGAKHYVPYHLILKWGSLYHRYKTYILDGTDIMSGVTTPLDGSEFFDNGLNLTFSGITHTSQNTIGIHPYYSSIYHQIVNDYLYYDASSITPTPFESAITNKVLYLKGFVNGSFTYYSSFVDNSRFDAIDKRYTILPSHGVTSSSNTVPNYSNDFNVGEQFNFKVDWVQDHGDEFSFSGVTFPSYNQYLTKNSNNGSNQIIDSGSNQIIDINSNNKKVIDLIATFSPQILESFENAFLRFSTENVDTYEKTKQFEGIKYQNFQELLKELVSVEKLDSDDLTNFDETARLISKRQLEKQKNLTTNILSSNNLLELTMVNPKELDLNILFTYTNVGGNSRNSDGTYNSSQLTNNSKYIELFIGEDIDGYYSEFFSMSDIELNEDNVLSYRFLIHIYAGWRQSGNQPSKSDFITYLSDNIILPHSQRESFYALKFLSRMSELERVQDKNNNLGIIKGFGQEPLKLEVYNNFKLFNDRWTAGNSLGQRLLMEEFLFLDKANRDIGNDLFFDVQKLIVFGESESQNLRLYGVISQLLSRNNLDLRALPAYVNFYGNDTTKSKVKTSNNVASILFGKFLDVDIEHSTPKMIVQYVGKQSAHINVSEISPNYKFKNDTFSLDEPNKNPILITDPTYFENENYKNSNRAVAFEVSFGDQNQGIFKGISLDQAQFRSTFESMAATERLARSESGSGISQVDTALYDIYKTRSYTCEVTCMGNVMIQPTMYFQLKNVPLFEGAYWIIEVSHRISNNSIETSFTGVRMPKDKLPDPKESFTASYRIFYDKIMNSAIAKLNALNEATTDEVITTTDGNFKTDRGGKIIDGETLSKESGVTSLGIPFNGYKNKLTIQKVKYKGNDWFRTIVSRFDGPPSTFMKLPTLVSNQNIVDPSKFPFTELKNASTEFYRLDFDNETLTKSYKNVGNVADHLVYSSKTTLFNPIKNKTKIVDASNNNLNLVIPQLRRLDGPADSGSKILTIDGQKYYNGLSLSPKLMKDLDLKEGDVIYFKIE